MCNERERLIGYVYDEVDAAERAVIDRHVESCAECRDEIRGFRSVREDLLAWDVPEHGSVWQPFAPARRTPWWRDVPAWAMAVALVSPAETSVWAWAVAPPPAPPGPP
jgi:anti-sigma factor ChrR (cupin superfamily)